MAGNIRLSINAIECILMHYIRELIVLVYLFNYYSFFPLYCLSNMEDRYRPPPQLAPITKGRLPSTGRCENVPNVAPLRRYCTVTSDITQFRPTCIKKKIKKINAYIMKGSSSPSFKKRNMLSGLTQLASQLTSVKETPRKSDSLAFRSA